MTWTQAGQSQSEVLLYQEWGNDRELDVAGASSWSAPTCGPADQSGRGSSPHVPTVKLETALESSIVSPTLPAPLLSLSTARSPIKEEPGSPLTRGVLHNAAQFCHYVTACG